MLNANSGYRLTRTHGFSAPALLRTFALPPAPGCRSGALAHARDRRPQDRGTARAPWSMPWTIARPPGGVVTHRRYVMDRNLLNR